MVTIQTLCLLSLPRFPWCLRVSDLQRVSALAQERHVGDLGNLEADGAGHAECSASNDKLKVWDLIGRAVVVYEGEDDLGLSEQHPSSVDGGAGAGLAAAVIARSAGVGQNYKSLCLCDGTVIWEATPDDYVKSG